MPKKSPWKSLISQSILKLKEREMINELYNKWFPSSICGTEKANSQRGYVSVELKYFGGLIFLLAIFICITFCLLGLEHFCYRHHRRVINPLQDKIQVWRDGKAAGRRNAVIDPNDISEIKKLQKKKIQVRKKSKISKISKISIATKTIKSAASRSPSVSSVISEGEDELIRMRMREAERGKKAGTTGAAATGGGIAGNHHSLGLDLSHLPVNALEARSCSAPGPIVSHDTNDVIGGDGPTRKSCGDDVTSNSSTNTQHSNAQQHCDIDLSSPVMMMMKETLKSSCKSLDSFSLRNVWKLLGEGKGEGEGSNTTETPSNTDSPNSEKGFESGLDRIRDCCDSSMSQSNHSISSHDVESNQQDDNNNNSSSGHITDDQGSLGSICSESVQSDVFDESFFMDKLNCTEQQLHQTLHQSEKLSVTRDHNRERKISDKSVQADLLNSQSGESLHKLMTCSNGSIRSIGNRNDIQQQQRQHDNKRSHFNKSTSIESLDQSRHTILSHDQFYNTKRLKQFGSSFEQCHTQSTSLDMSSDTGCATIHEELSLANQRRARSVQQSHDQQNSNNNSCVGGGGEGAGVVLRKRSDPLLRRQTVIDLLM